MPRACLFHSSLLPWKALKASPPQPEDFDGKYVCLEGTFDMDDHGHLGLWNGAIGKVTRFYALKAVE